jgi:cytoskeletal protein CcmA (bactofilin family)
MTKLEKREEKVDTVIGAGAKFDGNLEIQGGIRIDGKLKGNLKVQGLLVIGKTGQVEGEIFAKDALVGGIVLGKIRVENKIEFQSGASFEGELVCKGLVIQEGVKFDGTCSMTKEQGIFKKEPPPPEKK